MSRTHSAVRKPSPSRNSSRTPSDAGGTARAPCDEKSDGERLLDGVDGRCSMYELRVCLLRPARVRLCRICDEYDEIDGEEEQGNAIARSSALAHERETETQRQIQRERDRAM